MKQILWIIGVWALANLLLGISFQLTDQFWILFTFSLLTLICISLIGDRSYSIKKAFFSFKDISYGFVTGTILYAIFLVAYLLLKVLPFPLLPFVEDLYSVVGPTFWWHYIALVVIIIPGEEVFWRRFLQTRLVQKTGRYKGILIASTMYALAHIWTGNPMLVAAALTAGIAWGALYEWKKSLAMIIISHLIFDLWLLVIFPLNF